MATYPTVDESRDRLHRAGWSVGEMATAADWVVTSTKPMPRPEYVDRGQTETGRPVAVEVAARLDFEYLDIRSRFGQGTLNRAGLTGERQ
jgi:hypothetical protein